MNHRPMMLRRPLRNVHGPRGVNRLPVNMPLSSVFGWVTNLVGSSRERRMSGRIRHSLRARTGRGIVAMRGACWRVTQGMYFMNY